jgi:hypothetical protein
MLIHYLSVNGNAGESHTEGDRSAKPGNCSQLEFAG